MFTTQLSSGFAIGSGIVIFLLLAILAVVIFGPRFLDDSDGIRNYGGQSKEEQAEIRAKNRRYNRKLVRVIGAGAAAIVLLITAFVDFPFSMAYHEYAPVSGKVQGVESRFLASGTQGGGSTQVFPVQIGGQTYKCDDTRCAQLKPGDEVTLLCIRQWQWNGTPGYECNWGKLGLNV